jgi:aminoglycoside phosphotransferase (APT) family kinase protein
MAVTRFVPTDAALPSLAVVLDNRAMQRLFEQQLCVRRGSGFTVTGCEIERIKYRPRRNCLVGYKLRLRDARGEREQRLFAGTYAAEDATARYEKALSDARVATADFAPVALVRSLDMVVWAFPNERKLKALPLLSDAVQLRETLLPEIVRERWGDDWKIADLSHAVSNYFPEHSCCVNVKLTLKHVTSGACRTWEILGKTRDDDVGAQTYSHMAALCFGADSDVSYARPLAYQSDHRLLWQERVSGVTLHSLLTSGAADRAVLIRVASAVAALHGTPVAGPRRVMLSDLIDQLIAASEVIAAARPQCADRLRRTIDILIEQARCLDLRYNATWHGDLHSKNILVSPAQIHLVDVDRVASGPPLADLGSFLAELIYRNYSNGKPLEVLQPALDSMLAAYRQRASWPVEEPDIAWYTASALLQERALRCVTSLKLMHSQTLDELVATAARVAEGGLFVRSAALAGNLMRESGQAR